MSGVDPGDREGGDRSLRRPASANADDGTYDEQDRSTEERDGPRVEWTVSIDDQGRNDVPSSFSERMPSTSIVTVVARPRMLRNRTAIRARWSGCDRRPRSDTTATTATSSPSSTLPATRSTAASSRPIASTMRSKRDRPGRASACASADACAVVVKCRTNGGRPCAGPMRSPAPLVTTPRSISRLRRSTKASSASATPGSSGGGSNSASSCFQMPFARSVAVRAPSASHVSKFRQSESIGW